MSNPNNTHQNNSASRTDGPETETRSGYTHPEYGPLDFSQSAINRGQRRINYELTEACQKLSEALGLLFEVACKSPTASQQELAKIKELVIEATAISNDVASIKPPGCDPGYVAEGEKDPDPPPTAQ